MVLLRKTSMLAELIAAWNDGGDAGEAVYDDACAQFYNNPDEVRQFHSLCFNLRSVLVVSVPAPDRRSRVSQVLARVRQDDRRCRWS
jgi:hypothetical protein